MSKTTDTQIEKSKNLIKGLRKHVAERGQGDFNDKEISLMEKELAELQQVSDEVTRIREELAPKVAHMNHVLNEVKANFNENKKKLKGLHPQEQWANYGIPDKR